MVFEHNWVKTIEKKFIRDHPFNLKSGEGGGTMGFFGEHIFVSKKIVFCL